MKRFVEELAANDSGLRIDVLTIRESPHLPQYDQGLSVDTPANKVRISRMWAGPIRGIQFRLGLDQQFARSKSRPLRGIGWLLVLVSNSWWLAQSVLWLLHQRWTRRIRYDAVYVFVDPFTTLLLVIAAKWLNPDAKLVLEYGDPRPSQFTSKSAAVAAARLLQGKALKNAHAIVVTTRAVQEMYIRDYKIPADRFEVLYGGVDLGSYEAIPRASRTEVFTICHTGLIYQDSADPAPFFGALSDLHREGARLRVLMVGEVNDDVNRLVHSMSLDAIVTSTGHLPFKDALVYQRQASLLLAFGVRVPYKIPSKIAQYIAADVPIMLISELEDDPSADLILRLHRGRVVPNSRQEICDALWQAHQSWQLGTDPSDFNSSPTDEFSFDRLAARLHRLLLGQGRGSLVRRTPNRNAAG
jgi:glycosyltransferase involved in cell wall biosynthesis